MPNSALQAFASLYRELTKVGCPPPVAKTMEVWQAAVALGVGWEEASADAPTTLVGSNPQSDMDLLRARFKAHQEGTQLPEPKATSQADLNAMMGVFAPSTG